MKKGLTAIFVVAMFTISLFAMIPIAVSSSIPDQIRGRDYYSATADKHMSAITSPAEFGDIWVDMDGPPIIYGGSDGVVRSLTLGNYIPYKQYDYFGNGGTYQVSSCGNYGYDFVGSDQYCCREYAGHIEWLLENMGYDCEIWVYAGHAYNKVKLSDGQWWILNAMNIRGYEGVMDVPGSLGGVRYHDVYGANTMTGGVAFWDYNQNNWGENYIDNAMNMMPPLPDPYMENYGVFRNGRWFIDTDGDQKTDECFWYGTAGDIPVIQGNGNYGVYRNGRWFIDTDGDQKTDECFLYGTAGDIPVMSHDATGYFRDGFWKLDYDNDQQSEWWGYYGAAGDIPILADFDQDGYSEMAVFRNGRWFIDYTGDQKTDECFWYGTAGDIPVAW